MLIITSLLSLLVVIVTILVMLGVIVFVHELGHFLAAKAAGVLVEEFGLGMPPRLLGIQRLAQEWRILRGPKAPHDVEHTVYSVNSLPIGGFVRLYGDGAGGEGGAVDERLKHRSFDSAHVWWRLLIMVAGVLMNILLAVIIYYILIIPNGMMSERLPLIGSPSFAFGRTERSIGVASIVPDSPAESAGLRSEDIILEVRPVVAGQDWTPMRRPGDLIDIVSSHDGKDIEVHLRDFTSGRERTITVKPRYNREEKRAMIGVALMDFVTIRYDRGVEPYLAGWLHAWNITSYNVQTLKEVVSTAFEEKKPAIIGEAVTGPVGIGRVIDKIIKGSGKRTLENLLNLSALISLSLSVVNILPFPARDGGRVVMLLPEIVTGRRVNKRFEQYVNIIGFAFLIGLSIVITIKDVIHLW